MRFADIVIERFLQDEILSPAIDKFVEPMENDSRNEDRGWLGIYGACH